MSAAGPPPPRANPHLFGHAAAETAFLEAWRGTRLHHAWLIVGEDGVGKATFAFRLARRVLAGFPSSDQTNLALDPAHPVFQRVAAGGHADLLTVECGYDTQRQRQRTQIAIDDVRRISAFMALTPAEGGWRIAVIDGAERLNSASANALLKILEEPPPRALLLLTCTAPGLLPPTLRSRVRRIRLGALTGDGVDQALAVLLPKLPADRRAALAAVAHGAPGRAVGLAETEAARLSTMATETIDQLPSLTPSKAYAIADSLSRSEGAYATFLEMVLASAALRIGARGRAGEAGQIAAQAEAWQRAARLHEQTERANLDKRQAVITALGILAGAA